MEGKSSKTLAIVALAVAVVGLGIGFAAFSSSLTISSSATVTPSDTDFKVAFSGAKMTCVAKDGATAIASENITDGTVSNSGEGKTAVSAIEGVKVNFTKPGQEVVCTASIANSGQYAAYLKSIKSAGTIGCAAKTEGVAAGDVATEGLVNDVCKKISATVEVGSDSETTTNEVTGETVLTANHLLARSTSETVTLTIKYDGTDAVYVDGPVEITIPTVTLIYDSVKTANN